MQKSECCPSCGNNGINVEIQKGYKFIATGRALKDFPMKTRCFVCKRIIKYDIVEEQED